MGDTEFQHTLKSMPCLFTILKSDNFTETVDIIDKFDNITGPTFKNKKKHFLAIVPTMNYEILQNKTYFFPTHIISLAREGE